MIFTVPAMGGIRIAKAILKDPSLSPLQLGYEHLLENPNNIKKINIEIFGQSKNLNRTPL